MTLPQIENIRCWASSTGTIYATTVINSPFYDDIRYVGIQNHCSPVSKFVEESVAIANITNTLASLQIEGQDRDRQYNSVNDASTHITPIAFTNPAEMAPLRLSGEANYGSNYRAIFDYHSMAQIFFGGSYSTITPIVSGTTTIPSLNWMRECQPLIFAYGIHNNFTLKLQYKRPWESSTSWTDHQSISVQVADGSAQIIRGDAYSLPVEKRPVMNWRVQTGTGFTTSSCKTLAFVDEARIWESSLIVPKDGEGDENLQTGLETAGQINSSYQGFLRSSANEWNRYNWDLIMQGPGGAQNGNFLPFPTCGRCVTTSATPATVGFQPLIISGYSIGTQYSNVVREGNDFKITKKVPLTTLYGREKFTQYVSSGYGTPAVSVSGVIVTPASDGMVRTYFNINGGNYTKIITYASCNGKAWVAGTYPNEYVDNDPTLTFKLGHWKEGAKVTTDPICAGNPDFVVDLTQQMNYTEDQSLPFGSQSDGGRTVYDVASIMGSSVLDKQMHNNYLMCVEISCPQLDKSSKGADITFIGELEPSVPYPWAIIGEWDADGTYQPNAILTGKLLDAETNIFFPEEKTIYKQLEFNGMGPHTIDYAIANAPISGSYGNLMWRAIPNTSDKPKLLGITTASTNVAIRGCSTTPFGVNNTYSYPSASSSTPAGLYPTVILAKPNQVIYGSYNIGTGGSTANFSFVELPTRASTISVGSKGTTGSWQSLGCDTNFVGCKAGESYWYGCHMYLDITPISAGVIQIDFDMPLWKYPMDWQITKDRDAYPLVVDDPNVSITRNDWHRAQLNTSGLAMRGNPAALNISATSYGNLGAMCLVENSTDETLFPNGSWAIFTYDRLHESVERAKWKPCSFTHKGISLMNIANNPPSDMTTFVGKVSKNNVDKRGVDFRHSFKISVAKTDKIRMYWTVNNQDSRHGYEDNSYGSSSWAKIKAYHV